MRKTSPERWIRLRPPLSGKRPSASVFVRCASALAKVQRRPVTDEERRRALTEATEAALADVESAPVKDRAILSAATRVLCDLARQRWRVRVRQREVEVYPPEALRADSRAEKERVRRQELLKGDEQLEQPAVVRFIRDMEPPTPTWRPVRVCLLAHA